MSTRIEQPAEQTSPEEIEAIARSRIERARIDILLDQPYLASALLSIPLRGTSDRAIGKAVVSDGRRIVYRFDLVAALERPQVRLLIMHALMHIVLRHPERGGSRDWERWTVACDIALDLLFVDLGIQPCLDHETLRHFSTGTAETIYEKLDSPEVRSLRTLEQPGDAMLRPTEYSRGCDASEAAAERSQRDAFERTMDGAEVPSSTELEGMKRGVNAVFKRRMVSRGGSGRGQGCAEIDAAADAQVCWRSVLARFMCEPFDREWSFARPNRRHIWRGLYLPGPVPIEGGRFVVAIDTSGSMSDQELADMIAETDAIRRMCCAELTVLQFDADIHAVAEFPQGAEEDSVIGSTKVMRVYGRGGTDLRVPFAWASDEIEKGRKISALIVCTDGYGPLPHAPPADLPVLFMLTPNHRPPGFGQQIPLGRPARVGASASARDAAEADLLESLGF